VKKFENLYIATMTEYAKHFGVPVAFPPEEITMPLGKVLSDAGLKQLLIAETEKYAHVTYFFNGYRDTPFAGQVKELIPSRNVDRHDSEPRMMAMAIADRVVEVIKKQEFDVVVVNFANADMVAHTGNFNAGVIAVQTVDEQLGRLVTACEETGSYLVVTSDHGNAEVMIDAMTGSPETSHDPSPVPIYILGPEFKREKTQQQADATENEAIGILSDVAPTILDILQIPKPETMSGQSLLPLL
jgi:2,3-bisphosphoglycerate-independent phosphoglycerate mutase